MLKRRPERQRARARSDPRSERPLHFERQIWKIILQIGARSPASEIILLFLMPA
jgi:hypothetical protein